MEHEIDFADDDAVDELVLEAAEQAIEEEEEEEDNIGDTVFSKHWLFQCLIKTLETINKEPTGAGEEPLELESGVEEELCVLWDMSTNEDVAQFLNDHKAVDLFEGILLKTNSPRLAEISVGILANIAKMPQICMTMSSRSEFREMILSLLQSSDTPLILQLIRLLSTALNNPRVQLQWLSTINNTDAFFPTIQYILENCLNCDVLKSAHIFINKILYLDDQMSKKWLSTDRTRECVKCLLQSTEQLVQADDDDIEAVDYFWLIVHQLSLASEDFIDCYVEPVENEVYHLFRRFITDSFGDSVDFVISTPQRAAALSAAVAIVNQLMLLSSTIRSLILKHPDLTTCFNNLKANCRECLEQLIQGNESFQLALDQLNAITAAINDLELAKSGAPVEATR